MPDKIKVLIADKMEEEAVEILQQNDIEVDTKPGLAEEEIIKIIPEYQGLIVRSATTVTKKIIDAAAHLKVIGRAGVGVDNIDVASATERGIVVMNTPLGNIVSAGEHTIALIMSLARNIPSADATMKQSLWEKKKLQGVEIHNKVIGIVGLGKVGSIVAKCMQSLNAKVIAYDPFLSKEKAEELGIALGDLDEVLSKADFITVHTPLTDKTRNLINKNKFNIMKKTARIINCARGGIINEQDLYDALKEGKIAGAALDVFEQEPIAKDNPLLKCKNVVLTPHLGASTIEAQQKVAVDIATQFSDFLNKGIIYNAINAPAIKPELLKELKPYLLLAEKLGKIATQLNEGRIKELNVKYCGDLAEMDVQALTITIAKGILEPIMGSGNVNSVNALQIAEKRHIDISETKSADIQNYTNLITVTIKSDKGSQSVSGTLFADKKSRIVAINKFEVDFVPEGYMLITPHQDQPGVVGSVGHLLGKYNINIAGMSVGRSKARQNAVMAMLLDDPVPDDVLAQIKKIESVQNVKSISL